MKQIYLHGKLGKKFGRNFQLKVNSAEEAIDGLSANFEGFHNYLVAQAESGNQYIMITKNIASIKNLNEFKDCCINQENYKLKSNSKEIHFVPIAGGAELTALFTFFKALFSFGAGWSGGVATAWGALDAFTKTMLIVTATQVATTLLTKTPKPPTRQDPVSTKSFLMAGSVNRTAQGVAVPVGYGRLRIGSSNISVSKKCFPLQKKIATNNKDHLESYMNVTFLDLLCEGPIAGFANQNGSLIGRDESEEAVFLNDVPIKNPKRSDGSDGTRNYILNEGVDDDIPVLKLGDENDQLLFPGISTTIDKDEPIYGGSPYIADGGSAPHPYSSVGSAQDNGCKIFTHAVTNPEVDKIEFSLRASISTTDPNNGKTLSNSVHFAVIVVVDHEEYNLIDLADDSNTGYIIKSHDGTIQEFIKDKTNGTDGTRGLSQVSKASGDQNHRFVVQGIATAPYQFDIQITIGSVFGLEEKDLNPTFKIIKLSAELDPSISHKDTSHGNENAGIYMKRDLGMSYINEIISENLIYPHSACVLMKFDSKNFSQIPKRSYHVKMKKVLVPSNYDSEARIYDGPWDGTFKGEQNLGGGTSLDSISDSSREWTDNPAWIFFDLVNDPRFGLGKYGLNETNIDKWQLYAISKYCDELVDTDYPIETLDGKPILFNQVTKAGDASSEFFDISLQDSGLTEEEFSRMFGNKKTMRGMKIAFFIYQFANPDGDNIQDISHVLYEKSKNRSGEIKIEQRVLEERIEGEMTLRLRGKDFSGNTAEFNFNQDFGAYVDNNSDLGDVYVAEQQAGNLARKTKAQFGENHWQDHGREEVSQGIRSNPPPTFADGAARKKIIGACAPQINHPIVEPRFSANFYLTERSEALQMINMIAATFRGIVSYLDGRITAIQDRPKKAAMIFNNSSISPEGFSYSGVEKNKKISAVLLRFNNEEKDFKPDVVYEEDADAIKSFGYVQSEVAAQGITSISEARRYARWILLTSQIETETVTFKTSKEASFLIPGSIIEISDELRTGSDKSGRILGVNMRDKNGNSNPRVFIDKLGNFSPSFKKIEIVISAGMDRSTQDIIQKRSAFEESAESQEGDIEALQSPQMLIFSGNIGVDPDSSSKGPQGQTTYIENIKLKLPISVDISSNTITCNNHGFSEDSKVIFVSEGILPAGLNEKNVGRSAYFLHDVTKNTFKVHLQTEGDVNITDKGKDFLLNPGEEHFVCPERVTDFEAYVDSYDDLASDFLNPGSNPLGLNKKEWGKNHFFENGKSQGREVPFAEEQDSDLTVNAISQIQIGAPYILKGLFDSGRVIPSELKDNEALIKQKLMITQEIDDVGWKVSEFFGIMYLNSTGWAMITIGGSLRWVYVQNIIDRTTENCWFWSSDLQSWLWFKDTSPRLWYIHDSDQTDRCYLEVVKINNHLQFLIAIDHRINNLTLFMKPELQVGDIFKLKDKIDFKIAAKVNKTSTELGGYVLFNRPSAEEFTPPGISSVIMQEILSFVDLAASNFQENASYKNINIQDYIVVDSGESISGRQALRIALQSNHDVDFRNNYQIVIRDFNSDHDPYDSVMNGHKLSTVFVNENVIEISELNATVQDMIDAINDSSATTITKGSIEFFENARSISQRMYEGQKFRVLSIKENDDSTFEVNGLEYNPSKFAATDQKGIVRKPILPIPPQEDMGVPEEPRNLILTDLTLR